MMQILTALIAASLLKLQANPKYGIQDEHVDKDKLNINKNEI